MKGGARIGAGRPRKDTESEIRVKLKPLEPLALKAMAEGMKNGDTAMVRLFYSYYWGTPIQRIEQDITTQGEKINQVTVNIVKSNSISPIENNES